MSSFEIIVGERWRGDEEILERLATFAEADQRPDGASAETPLAIRDVVEIVVDGLTVTARVPEDNVFLIVRDLIAGLEEITAGRRDKVFVTFQEDPWELCIARTGSETLISFYGTTPPRGVIVKDRPVALAELCRAAARTADRLARSLSRVNGAIVRSGPVAEMARGARRLRRWASARSASTAGKSEATPTAPGPAEPSPQPRRRYWGPWGDSSARPDRLSLAFWFDADDPFLRSYRGEHPYDLHALLARGQIGLRGGGLEDVDLPLGYLMHDLEGWVTASHHLVMSHEWGEKEASASLCGERVRLSLESDGKVALHLGLRSGDPVLACPLDALVQAVAEAGRAAAEMFLERNARLDDNLRLSDLLDEIDELAAWLADDEPSARTESAKPVATPPHASGADPVERATPGELPAKTGRSDERAIPQAARVRFTERWRLEAETAQLGIALPHGLLLARVDGRMLCMESRTGRTLWRLPPAFTRAASFTPDGIGVVAASSGRIVFIDTSDGSIRWEVGAADARLAGAPAQVSIAGHPHLAVGLGDQRLLLLDEASGACRWEFNGRRGDCFHASDDGRRLYVATPGGVVHALELGDGRVAWQHKTRARIDQAPLCWDGLVMVVTRHSSREETRMVALDALTGEPRWEAHLGRAVDRPALLWDDLVLVATGLDEGAELVALCAADGSVVWKRSLGSVGVAPPSAPVRVGKQLVVQTDGGEIQSLDPATGDQRWSRSLAGGIVPDVLRNPTPRVARGAIYAAYDAVYVVDPDSGRVIHRIDDNAGIPDDVLVDEAGRLFVCEEGDHICCLELTTLLTVVS